MMVMSSGRLDGLSAVSPSLPGSPRRGSVRAAVQIIAPRGRHSRHQDHHLDAGERGVSGPVHGSVKTLDFCIREPPAYPERYPSK